MYIIRTSKGIMTAKVSTIIAGGIFSRVKGHWRPYQETGGKKTHCFEITEDSVFEIENEFSLYLWEGSKILEE